ncbi:MAG: hypothetical protein U5K84_11175 [Alkalibacterium sp.]|nr:hypothetical protein [Alkalibacterium sp.]
MLRGISTLSNSFNVLSEKQKNLATNAANTMTPGYKSPAADDEHYRSSRYT